LWQILTLLFLKGITLILENAVTINMPSSMGEKLLDFFLKDHSVKILKRKEIQFQAESDSISKEREFGSLGNSNDVSFKLGPNENFEIFEILISGEFE